MFLRLFRASAVRRQVGSCDSPGKSAAEESAGEWVCGSDMVKRTGKRGDDHVTRASDARSKECPVALMAVI